MKFRLPDKFIKLNTFPWILNWKWMTVDIITISYAMKISETFYNSKKEFLRDIWNDIKNDTKEFFRRKNKRFTLHVLQIKIWFCCILDLQPFWKYNTLFCAINCELWKKFYWKYDLMLLPYFIVRIHSILYHIRFNFLRNATHFFATLYRCWIHCIVKLSLL